MHRSSSSVLGAAVLAQPPEYVISTFAGGATPPTPILGVDMPLGSVQSIAADAMGNTYFVASHCVFKLNQNGVVTRIAGNGHDSYSGDGGLRTRGSLSGPIALAEDGKCNIYIADSGKNAIRILRPTHRLRER